MVAYWQPVHNDKTTLYDSARYNAFPCGVTRSNGDVYTYWDERDNHYGGNLTPKGARLASGSSTWQLITPTGGFTAPAGAAEAAGVVVGVQAYKPPAGGNTASRIYRSTDGVAFTLGATIDGSNSGGGGTFPSDIAYVNDGSPNGLLLIYGYGTQPGIYASTDAGVTWSVRATWAPDGSSEGCIVEVSPGVLLLTQRHIASGNYSTMARTSTDYGVTWTAQRRIVSESNGLPKVTRLQDGTLMMPVRRREASEAWGYAQSGDGGVTWARYAIDSTWMMYGVFLAVGADKAVLVGGSMDRGSYNTNYLATGNSDIWTLRFEQAQFGFTAVTLMDPPRADVELTLPALATRVELYRSAGSSRQLVRGSTGAQVSLGYVRILDYDVPVGRDFHYDVVAYTAAGAELLSQAIGGEQRLTPATPTVAYLTDPLAPPRTLAVAAGDGTQATQVWKQEAATTATTAAGLTFGMPGPYGAPSTNIKILGRNRAESDAIRDLLLSSGSVMFRSEYLWHPTGNPCYLTEQVTAEVSYVPPRAGETTPEIVTVWTLPAQEIQLTGLPAQIHVRTWEDVADEFAGLTWEDVATKYGTSDWATFGRGL